VDAAKERCVLFQRDAGADVVAAEERMEEDCGRGAVAGTEEDAVPYHVFVVSRYLSVPIIFPGVITVCVSSKSSFSP